MACHTTPIRRILCVLFGAMAVYSLFSFIAFTQEYSDSKSSLAMNALCPDAAAAVAANSHLSVVEAATPTTVLPISRHATVNRAVTSSGELASSQPPPIPWHDRLWHALICPLYERTGRWTTVFLVLGVIAGVISGWLYRGLLYKFQHYKHNYPGLSDDPLTQTGAAPDLRASSAVAAVAEPIPPPDVSDPTVTPKTLRWWIRGLQRVVVFVLRCAVWFVVQAWSDDGLLSRLFVVSFHSIDCGVSTVRCLYCPIRCGNNLWLLAKRYTARCKSTYQSVRRVVRWCFGYRHEADYTGIAGGTPLAAAAAAAAGSAGAAAAAAAAADVALSPLPEIDDSTPSVPVSSSSAGLAAPPPASGLDLERGTATAASGAIAMAGKQS